MQVTQGLYIVFSITLAVAGMSVVGMSIRSYIKTKRRDMVHLSIGFVLVVAAAVGTMVSAFINEFQNTPTLLSVNYLITTMGYLFVMYSLTPSE